jgi:asparagine synthase (glutamine-hydrolysing)
MPGIVGLITTLPSELAKPQLLRMVETICHDPTYNTGTMIDESLGVYLAWTVRHHSFSDGMPVRNERGDVEIVFSGEEFPEPDVAIQLKRRGHRLGSEEPSHLVHLYEDDPHFPAGLNGRFHGLLIDRTRGTALLFNDRYGMHRIYYHESADALYFAVESKAILGVRPELRLVDPQGLGELVSCGCVLENRTLFRGIFLLAPGSAWTFRNGSIERKRLYFQPREWEDQGQLGTETYYRELRSVFSRNLQRYFVGQQRIAVSLTGGLDTRMIMAWRKASPGSLPCYTFGGKYRDTQDVIISRRVAEVCKQSHQVITLGDDFLSRFSHYADRAVFLTDGCADVSCSADLYLNEQAAEIAPVRMTGNYGGEVLRGVQAFKPVQPTPGLFRREFLSHIDAASETYSSLLRDHPISFAVFRQAPWHHYGRLALEESQLSLRSPYLDNDFVRTVFRGPESSFSNNETSLRLIADGDEHLQSIRTDRGLAGINGRLSAGILRRALELSFKAEYAYNYGMPQWLARIDHIFSRLHLERYFLGRHKFSHFRVWYRDSLSDYVREMLLDDRTLSRPYLNRHNVEVIVRSHLAGNRNYTAAIHTLLTIELLHRLFLDSN